MSRDMLPESREQGAGELISIESFQASMDQAI
jgi:hypothetical protein